ncbi:MAG TPA: hypothetical protein VF475_09600 [Sphingobium sp.]
MLQRQDDQLSIKVQSRRAFWLGASARLTGLTAAIVILLAASR